MADPFIPLSVLALDHPEPVAGWAVHLADRDIEVILDDCGRACVTRGAVRSLMTEQREQQEAGDRHRQEIERRAIEQDRAFRASLPRGVPAGQSDEARAQMHADMLADWQAQTGQGRRRTLLEDALDRENTLTFHPIGES